MRDDYDLQNSKDKENKENINAQQKEDKDTKDEAKKDPQQKDDKDSKETEKKDPQQNEDKDSNDIEKKDSFFKDLDEDRPNLLMINKKFNEMNKKEEEEMLKKKRKRNLEETDIIYDANKKELKNCFCPSPEELNDFLEHCEIREIKDEELLSLNNQSENEKENNFDPEEFMKMNTNKNINNLKDSLSLEDLTSFANGDKNEYVEKMTIKIEEENYTPDPKLKDNSDLIKSILDKNNKVLSDNQREELNKLISNIKDINIKTIIENYSQKLNIVFDLDNTCILGNVIKKEQCYELKNKFPEKNLRFFSFSFNGKSIYICLIIRKGLLEFFNFSKDFCNFYISTLGVEAYGEKIRRILEETMDIKFLLFKGREKGKNNKLLEDLKLFKKDTLIFDDSPLVWGKNCFNVIISKKFNDIEINDFISNNKTKSDLKIFLSFYFPFFYYQMEKRHFKLIEWKNEKIIDGRLCPFYQFNNMINKNECFSGEYLDSTKLQFFYMREVIKIVYYLTFNYDVHVSDALQLIRFNIFYNKHFCLKYYRDNSNNRLDILKNIIESCGGQIFEENIKTKSQKDYKILFFVCSKENYFSVLDNIKKDLVIYENSKVISDKYIVDSLFFMTNLENEIDLPEYSFSNPNNDDFSHY